MAKPISCTIRPPVAVRVGDPATSDFCSGCSFIDVTFPKSFYVSVHEIQFKNYYTASVSVLARTRVPSSGSTEVEKSEWQVCVRDKRLMPNPHCETAAEDCFTISAADMHMPLQNIIELRLVLRQPSPIWKEFKIEELQLFREPTSPGAAVAAAADVQLPEWIAELDNAKAGDEIDRQLKGVSSTMALSRQMQQLWSLTEQMRAEQTRSVLGRYDIDGCYDINLLSYT